MMYKRSSLTRRIIWAVLGCSLLLFVLKGAEWQSRLASVVSYPFLRARLWMRQLRTRWDIAHAAHDTLVTRLTAVVAERDALLRELIEREATYRYAADSREVREFKSRFRLAHAHIGQVLLVNRSPAGHYLFVTGGSMAGIEPDMVVLANNCLIGRVSEVYPQFCKVLLTTDKNCRVAAVCTKTGTRGIYEGCNDEHLAHLNFVSHFDRIQVGDLVVSQGAGLLFPRGFALGRVRSDAIAGVFHVVEVEPVIEVNKLDFCLVVKRQDVEVAAEPSTTEASTTEPSAMGVPTARRRVPTGGGPTGAVASPVIVPFTLDGHPITPASQPKKVHRAAQPPAPLAAAVAPPAPAPQESEREFVAEAPASPATVQASEFVPQHVPEPATSAPARAVPEEPVLTEPALAESGAGPAGSGPGESMHEEPLHEDSLQTEASADGRATPDEIPAQEQLPPSADVPQ